MWQTYNGDKYNLCPQLIYSPKEKTSRELQGYLVCAMTAPGKILVLE